mgnify:FL=1
MNAAQRLPPGLEPGDRLGEGRRSVVYEASWKGQQIALKLYRPEFVSKYRERFGLDIARFEYDRNQAFIEVPGLARYAARPLAALGQDDGFSPAFLQERVEGLALTELGMRERGLPEEVIAAGRRIVRLAESAGLHDLDLFYRNILVRKNRDGWAPVIHDFNLVPQYLFPPNPFLLLAYRLGIRKKSHRDYRCIRQWREFSDSCSGTT